MRSASASSTSSPISGSVLRRRLLAAALAGALVALFISHRRGIYYAFMTIAFGQIFWIVAIKSHSVTGGEDGLLKIARLPADFGFVIVRSHRQRLALLFRAGRVRARRGGAVAADAFALSAACSPAIRQSETRAAHLGYNVWLYKASIFTLSAALSGLAGGLFAMAQLARLPRRDEPALSPASS